jgi:hypothetical protein
MCDLELYRDKRECSLAASAGLRREPSLREHAPEELREETGFAAMVAVALSRWNPFPRL